MRSSCKLGLAAVALSFGVANASAAAIDQAQTTAPQASLQPAQTLGSFGGGFSAVKAEKSKGLIQGSAIEALSTGRTGAGGLVRPDVAQGWRDGLAALTVGIPGAAAVSTGAQQAVLAPPGMPPNTAGLAALKGGAGERGGEFIELPSDGYSGRVGIQRPEGGSWSDRGRESLRSDSLGMVPGNLLGPSSR